MAIPSWENYDLRIGAKKLTLPYYLQHKNVEDEYKVGNSVWLLTKNIKTERPSKKLDHKMVNPFKIKALVGLSG